MIYEVINGTYEILTQSYSQYTHDKTLVQENYRTQSIPESLSGFNFLTDKGCLFIYIGSNINFDPITNNADAEADVNWHLYNLFSDAPKFDLKPMDTEISKDLNQENKHVLLMSYDSTYNDGDGAWYTIPNYIGKFISNKYYYMIDCDWIIVDDTKIEPDIDGYYKLGHTVDKIYFLGFNKPYCHDQIVVYNETRDVTPDSEKSYYTKTDDTYSLANISDNAFDDDITYYEKVINYENIWNTKILNDNVSYSWFNENGELITNSPANSIVVEVW